MFVREEAAAGKYDGKKGKKGKASVKHLEVSIIHSEGSTKGRRGVVECGSWR